MNAIAHLQELYYLYFILSSNFCENLQFLKVFKNNLAKSVDKGLKNEYDVAHKGKGVFEPKGSKALFSFFQKRRIFYEYST